MGIAAIPIKPLLMYYYILRTMTQIAVRKMGGCKYRTEPHRHTEPHRTSVRFGVVRCGTVITAPTPTISVHNM